MTYNDVIEMIKIYALEGYTEITIAKPKNVGIHLSLARADFVLSFPNPDEMTISWANPRFRAKDALNMSNPNKEKV